MKKLIIFTLLVLSLAHVQPAQAYTDVRSSYILIQNVLINTFQVTHIEKTMYLNKPAIVVRYTTNYKHFVYSTTTARDAAYEKLIKQLY